MKTAAALLLLMIADAALFFFGGVTSQLQTQTYGRSENKRPPGQVLIHEVIAELVLAGATYRLRDLNEAGRAADAAREVNGAVVACWLR